MNNQSAYCLLYMVGTLSPVEMTRGLATIMVFAECKCQAFARAGKLVSRKDYRILKVLRIHQIQKTNREMFGAVLKSLYAEAELYGAALHYDPLRAIPACC